MNSRLPALILASQSPRRKMLLEQAGFEFEVIPPNDSVEKGACSECSPEEFVLESAFLKARAISEIAPSGAPEIILAADTVAECQGQILGKPTNQDHAEQMLRLVSGKRHRVLTGVCLWHRSNNVFESHLEQTVLRMDPLSDSMLAEILESDLWVGKAGAFGYQDGLDWVHIENGLESNVVGLPVERLPELIQKLDSNLN